MLMDAQVRNCMPLTVRVDGAGRRISNQASLMQIIFYSGVTAQRPVVLCNRRLVHKEICPHTVNGNRVLRDKHAGGVIPVKGCLLPS